MEKVKDVQALIQTIEGRTEDWEELLAQAEAEEKELFAWLTIILATILSITLIGALLIMGLAWQQVDKA